MSETKFTPGPWCAVGPMPNHDLTNPHNYKPIFPDGLWYILPKTAIDECNVERLPIAVVDYADDYDDLTRTETAPAVAALIAAAPDLYAALEGIANADQSGWEPEYRTAAEFRRWAKNVARAALAKAVPHD